MTAQRRDVSDPTCKTCKRDTVVEVGDYGPERGGVRDLHWNRKCTDATCPSNTAPQRVGGPEV